VIGVFEEELRGRRVVGLGVGARRLGILFDGRRLGWEAKAPKTRCTTYGVAVPGVSNSGNTGAIAMQTMQPLSFAATAQE
jgi:hypothetical protein